MNGTLDLHFDSFVAAHPLRVAMVSETYPPEVNGVRIPPDAWYRG